MRTFQQFLSIFFIFLTMAGWSQPNYSAIEPASQRNNLSSYIDQIEVTPPANSFIQDQSNHGPLHIGNQFSVGISANKHGLWETSNSGELVWRCGIKVTDVRAVSLIFSNLVLPEGGMFYLLDLNGDVVKGPITNKNLHNTSYATPILKGSEFTLEYNAPKVVSTLPIIKLNNVTLFFDDLIPETKVSQASAKRNFGESGNCQVNINCEEGDNWSEQKKATVRIILANNGKSYACTGTLMNNSEQDCHPYILTADHCIVDTDGGLPTSSDYDQWVFYFDYESPDCENPLQEGNLADNTSVGCNLVARAGTSGDKDSDFLLLELDNPTDLSFYNVYFAGWDRRNVSSVSGVAPHHPSADIKKIGTYSEPVESDTWGGSVLGTHWRVNWAVTNNGQSVMEQGSSGAALYNAAGLVMGTLTGGSSSCESSGGMGPNEPDLFGKMTYHFNHSSSSLRPYLDASGSGRQYIAGINYPCTEDPLNVNTKTDEKSVRIYPMPISGESFEVSGIETHIKDIRVFALQGKQIPIGWQKIGKEHYEIFMGNAASGIYYLELLDESSSLRYKLIVQ